MKIVVAITGATGAIYGVRLLEELERCNIETHLIMSEWAENNISVETEYSSSDVKSKASYVYGAYQMDAAVSSGSFRHDGMVIIPCSMKSLAAISIGYAGNLICRAADVTLKEGRPLIICPRETPLNSIHLENMLKLSKMGVKIVPPMPAFYNKPRSIADLVNHHVSRVMDQLGVDNDITKRWGNNV